MFAARANRLWADYQIWVDHERNVVARYSVVRPPRGELSELRRRQGHQIPEVIVASARTRLDVVYVVAAPSPREHLSPPRERGLM
jgi:hypothetical protein